MPIKDPQKAREYKRLWIADKRKKLVEPVEPKEKILASLQKLFLPCPTCTNMRKKYGSRPDETWCLNCHLKAVNEEVIIPLSLVQQILALVKKK
jgi:hypothetical protein